MKIEDAIKQKKFFSPQHKANVNLIYTHNWLNDRINTIFKNSGITHQQYNILRILRGAHPKTLCAGEIKEVMLDKNPDLTRLCDRMVEKGFISRQFNEQNRRQVMIGITNKGLRLLEKIDPEIDNTYDNIKQLTEEEYEMLSNLLDKFRGDE